MNKKTLAGIVFWVLVCALVLVCFLWFIKPLMGIIALVVVVLGYNLILTLSPRVNEAVKEGRQAFRDRLRAFFSKKKAGPGNPSPTFVPTHVLVCDTFSPPIRRLVDKENFVVGRNPGCDLCVPGDRSISGQHCRITYGAHSRQYYIEDLRSTMGTFLGTKRLEANAPEKLFDESVISLSNLRFVFSRSTTGPVYQPLPPGGPNVMNNPTMPGDAGMLLTLSITFVGQVQTKTAVVEEAFFIGRSSQNSLVLSDDPLVGRRHAQLFVQQGLLFVKDLGSQNGTTLGATRLPPNQAVQIANMETLKIGKHLIQISY